MGDDTLDGGLGNDTLNGGAGNDTATYAGATAGVTVSLAVAGVQNTGGAGIDTLVSIENLVGSAFGDTLTGNAGANVLSGGAGNDTLDGGLGNDTLDGGSGADTMMGGAGNDTYYVDNAGDVVNESYGSGTDLVYSSVSFSVGNNYIEDLTLTGSADIAGTGNWLDNTLIGNAGDNVLSGGTGNDILDGGLGNDTLNGGAGQDSYQFNSALNTLTNVDLVAGFSVADDDILLSQSVFTAAGGPGTLAAGAFFTGASAAPADDRIIYNSGAGALLYDSDGDGAAGAVQFASLAPSLALTNNNFQLG